jgi:hypothetical protein
MSVDALSAQAHSQLVPTSYAEKAMASLMQLHSELMDEKERRVDLFRKLMEREQALAELKMYVKMLEEKVAATAPAPRPAPVQTPPPAPAPSMRQPMRAPPPMPPQVMQRQRPLDGWKTW